MPWRSIHHRRNCFTTATASLRLHAACYWPPKVLVSVKLSRYVLRLLWSHGWWKVVPSQRMLYINERNSLIPTSDCDFAGCASIVWWFVGWNLYRGEPSSIPDNFSGRFSVSTSKNEVRDKEILEIRKLQKLTQKNHHHTICDSKKTHDNTCHLQLHPCQHHHSVRRWRWTRPLLQQIDTPTG